MGRWKLSASPCFPYSAFTFFGVRTFQSRGCVFPTKQIKDLKNHNRVFSTLCCDVKVLLQREN